MSITHCGQEQMEKLDIVVLEEHYADAELSARLGRPLAGPLASGLTQDVEARVARLDRLGIATEVLALAPPGLQGLLTADAALVARGVNDRLAAMVAGAPGRLAGWAALPTADPVAAADELARCVETLGMVGAMIHGPTGGRFLDAPEFAPILSRAAALGVPLYLHPSDILTPVRESYFEPYTATHPMFLRAAWGYTIETGTQAMRLVMAQAFDRHPGLRLMLGHLGEAIPYLMARIDESLARDTPVKNFRAVFTQGVTVTTSGFFSTPALECCRAELGLDRILFSIDAPYAPEQTGLDWLRGLDMPDADKAALAGGSARRLLGLGA